MVFCKDGNTVKALTRFLNTDNTQTGGWEDAAGVLKTRIYAGQNLAHWEDVINEKKAAGQWTESWDLSPGTGPRGRPKATGTRNAEADAKKWVAKQQAEALEEIASASGNAGHLRVLVSTDKGSRAIDIPNLGCVVNFEMPRVWDERTHAFGGVDIDTYTQRIGRVGRADLLGVALTIVTSVRDVSSLQELVSVRRQPGACLLFETKLLQKFQTYLPPHSSPLNSSPLPLISGKFEPQVFPLEGKKDALIDPGTNANAEAQNALRVTGDPDILQEWISHQMDVRRGDLARYAAESAGGASAFGAAP
jgi:hypothetical protein